MTDSLNELMNHEADVCRTGSAILGLLIRVQIEKKREEGRRRKEKKGKERKREEKRGEERRREKQGEGGISFMGKISTLICVCNEKCAGRMD